MTSRCRMMLIVTFVVLCCCAAPCADAEAVKLLTTEKVSGEGVWVHPVLERQKQQARRVRVTVWFDTQFLGDGEAYRRRAKEFAGRGRRELRATVMMTLKTISQRSFDAAKKDLDKLQEDGKISDLRRHWIVNGFSCVTTPREVEAIKSVAGVKKIFLAGPAGLKVAAAAGEAPVFKPVERRKFDPDHFKHPWYVRYLQADKVWKKFRVAGQGTLNVVHDFNFVFSDNATYNLYRSPTEKPGNGKDDDGNGLVDDYHGYDFDRGSARLTIRSVPLQAAQPRFMHGYMCASVICGAGVEGKPYEFGIAPEASWAGVIAARRLESAVEWAIEQGADTYSMSFSIPGLGDYRSHWRKVMEHGSFCGVYFVSGAGNFAQSAAIPVQMRTPEDIPEVVFAAAGVQRNFTRTPFSSKGPVEWKTEHYRDGRVQKPEVCAFNMGLPLLLRDGTVRPTGLNGNSFAGPMFGGSIALMLSADSDLLPWDLKEIITATATDVAAKGIGDETGHGLINCYRAVKEVLRRKAVREGADPKAYEGREDGDTLDIAKLQEKLKITRLVVVQVQADGEAAKRGVKPGDMIVSYHGQKITSRQDLMRAKQAATKAKTEEIAVVVHRDGKPRELTFKPGPLGVVPVATYEEPTFK